jgi:N-acetyl sugar amidotransferase
MTRPYQICTRCVMDTTDPDIQFDANGMCNHCHTYDMMIKKYVLTGDVGRHRVQEIVNQIKKDGAGKQYDCVIGVSGGVDSTFTAYKVKQLGLRPLAVHLDNGWDSELAVKNIENICRKLGIDLDTIVLDWEEFRDLQLAFLKASTPDSEIPSDHAIVAAMSHKAKAIGVKYVVAGYNVRTETHLPSAWSQGHYDWRYISSIHKQFGSIQLKTFVHLDAMYFFLPIKQQKFVNILDYLDYSKKEAIPILEKELDWQNYGNKHHESIYTRWYQGYWLPRKFGYDKRRTHMSSLICSGEMVRAKALEILDTPPYSPSMQEEDTAYVVKKLGITDEELNRILNLPKKSYWDYPNYGWVIHTRAYLGLHSIYRALKRQFIKNYY